MDSAHPSRRGTALVTGASSGIGEELARLFAQDRYDLVLVARDRSKLDSLAAALGKDHSIAAHVIPADLAEPQGPEQVVAAVRALGLDIDVLVNNAGVGTYGPFGAQTVASQLGMIQVNMTALTHLTGLLLPGMMARRAGKILNVGSTAGFQPGPLMAVYYATKAYVLSFSEALANELEGSGVTVTCLCPGPTRTAFQARAQMERSKLVSGRLMDAAAVARAGYAGLMRGKHIVIPGLQNRLLAQSIRFSPRQTVVRIVRRMMEQGDH